MTTENTSATTSAKIRPQLEKYTASRAASGNASRICGDEVSVALSGTTLDETYGLASAVTGTSVADLNAKYKDRNLGQQRMILGNLVRGALKGKDEEKVAKARKAFDKEVPKLRKAADQRTKEATAAKEAAKKAADKAKADKAKAKDEAKEAKEKAKAAKAKAATPKPAKAPKAPAKPTAQ